MPTMSPPPPGARRGPRRALTEEEKKNSPKLTWPLFKRVLTYLVPYRLQLGLALLCLIAAGILGVLPSILTGKMIDLGLYGKNMQVLLRLAFWSLAVLVASNLVTVGQVLLTTRVGQYVTYDMRNQMYAHMQKMGHRFFTSNQQGEIITRMTEDIGGVQAVLSTTMVNLFSDLITVLIVLVTLFQRNWILALVGVAVVPFLVLPTRLVGKRRWEIADATQTQRDRSNQILNETLSVSGQLLVKLFTREQREYENFRAVNLKATKLAIRERLAGMWFWRGLNVLRNMGPLLIYVVGGLVMVRHGAMDLTVGDVTVMVTLINKLYNPVDDLLNIHVDLIRSMALFSRIFLYFDLKPEVESPKNGYQPKEVRGDLAFEQVSFCYSAEQPLLRAVHFQVPQGRMVAIVGTSGAGKSTLVNLIPRLYDVTEGAVLVDGVDVRRWDLYALRRQIAMVTQETYLFNDTVRANLLYAKEGATEEELISACQKAHIHDLITSLPDGYDTEVGNRGFKLSGGEKQRISIARAILKDPKILILDEATSSLDSISETLIQQAISPLLTGRTALVIAHRLTTILAADEILVMEHGKIVERGKHSALVEKEGVYRKLYETQFRYALDDYEQRRQEGRALNTSGGPEL